MLKAFHAARESPAEIERAIKKHLEKKRQIEKVLMTEEVKEENDPVAEKESLEMSIDGRF